VETVIIILKMKEGVLMSSVHVKWGKSIVKLNWVESDVLPDHKLITSAHGFCFLEENLMLVNLEHRGWDFPGGHVERDETPQETILREALEEGCVEGSTELLGYVIVDHTENPNWDEASKYPKIGYQVFYKMDIQLLHSFDKKHESLGRIFIDPSSITDYYHQWNPLYGEILHIASSKLLNLKTGVSFVKET
jgi:8-oxo-dGTP diphosphatase